MRGIIATGMMFLSVVCFAQTLNIIGNAPQPDAILYQIQVGAFSESANAERAFNRLQDAGLDPVYQDYMGLIRVAVAGIDEEVLHSAVAEVRNAGFSDVWVREEPVTARYRIQVGAFGELANAERAFNCLQNAGLDPVYEEYMEYTRVLLPDVDAYSFHPLLDSIANAGFSEVWIREEPYPCLLEIDDLD